MDLWKWRNPESERANRSQVRIVKSADFERHQLFYLTESESMFARSEKEAGNKLYARHEKLWNVFRDYLKHMKSCMNSQ